MKTTHILLAAVAGYAIAKMQKAAIGKSVLKYEFDSNKELNEFVRVYNDHQAAKRNAAKEMDDELNEIIKRSRQP